MHKNNKNNKPDNGTCANSHTPDKSTERKIADVVIRECDMEENPETPYRDIAQYKMVPKDDDNGTFSSSRS